MLDPTPSSPSSSLELSRKLGCVIIPLHWQSRVTPHPVTQRGFQTRGPGPKPRAACPFHAGCISMTCPACRETPSNPRAKYFQDSLHLTTDLHLGSMASDNLQQAAQSHTNQDICRGFRKLLLEPAPNPAALPQRGSTPAMGSEAPQFMGFFIVHSLLPGPQCWCL